MRGHIYLLSPPCPFSSPFFPVLSPLLPVLSPFLPVLSPFLSSLSPLSLCPLFSYEGLITETVGVEERWPLHIYYSSKMKLSVSCRQLISECTFLLPPVPPSGGSPCAWRAPAGGGVHPCNVKLDSVRS